MPQPKCLRNKSGGRPAYIFRFRDELTQSHHEPHIHVSGPEFGELSINLNTLQVIAPPHVSKKCPLRRIKAILKEHQESLLLELEQMRKEVEGDVEPEL